MRKKNPVPHMDLFRTRKVNVLSLNDSKHLGSREHEYTFGLDAVLGDANANVTKVVTNLEDATEGKVLCSLTSPLDIYRLLDTVEHKSKKIELIIGGQGAFPIVPILSVAQKVALGRCEGRATDILYGESDNVITHENQTVKIGQARRLLHGENSVGCQGSCAFCQYAATHRTKIGHDYNAGKKGYIVTEDRWQNIRSKTGNQTTALDGWSEYTRKKVGKPVEDREIISGLSRVLSEIQGTMRLKVFQIVGFPWETGESLQEDIRWMRDILSRVTPRRDGKSRIMMMVTVTPFSPEPLTRMQNEPANVETRWRDVLLHDDNRCIFDSRHLNAFILPQVPGPVLLAKRVVANRSQNPDILRKIHKMTDMDKIISACGSAIFEKKTRHYLDDIVIK